MEVHVFDICLIFVLGRRGGTRSPFTCTTCVNLGLFERWEDWPPLKSESRWLQLRLQYRIDASSLNIFHGHVFIVALGLCIAWKCFWWHWNVGFLFDRCLSLHRFVVRGSSKAFRNYWWSSIFLYRLLYLVLSRNLANLGLWVDLRIWLRGRFL